MANISNNWLKEFGPEYNVPQAVLEMERFGELVDCSWHNDVCPSFGVHGLNPNDPTRHLTITLWVDHPNPERREWDSARQFAVSVSDDGITDGFDEQYDTIEKAIAAWRATVEKWGKPIEERSDRK